jgi:integrase
MNKNKSYTLKRNRSHKLEAVKETYRGKTQWKIKGLYIGDKRVRKFFVTQQRALEFIAGEDAKIRNLGERARNISGRLHEEALQARDLLQKYNTSIVVAAEHFVMHMERQQKSKLITEISNEYIEKQKINFRSARHLEDVKSRLDRFGKTFGTKLASEIETRDIDNWLTQLRPLGKKTSRYSPQSKVNFHRVVRSLFSYAISMGYASSNPTKGATIPKVKESTTGIYSPEKLKMILNAASPDILPLFVLGAFAGLRASEIGKLEWESINFERKVIIPPSSITKSAKRRIVPMQPNLLAFLKPYIEKKGKVLPLSRRMIYYQCLPAIRSAGFGAPGTETREEIEAGIKLIRSPKNALRHSYASYRLAATSDASKTASEIGHPNTNLLFSTYRELVSLEEANEYWNIFPNQEDPISL